jgi:hypothetical protein
MKNSNDIIGNRTRDLPACSAVPQLTAPPHVLVRRFLEAEIQEETTPCIDKYCIFTLFDG